MRACTCAWCVEEEANKLCGLLELRTLWAAKSASCHVGLSCRHGSRLIAARSSLQLPTGHALLSKHAQMQCPTCERGFWLQVAYPADTLRPQVTFQVHSFTL